MTALTLILVATGIYFGFQVTSSYKNAISTNERLANRLDSIEKVQLLGSQINAPGNDVFTSRNPQLERERLLAAFQRYLQQYDQILSELRAAEENTNLSSATRHFEEAHKYAHEMMDRSQTIFSQIDLGNIASAAKQMARMDQAHSAFRQNISASRESIRATQRAAVGKQAETAEHLERLKLFLSLAGVLMICAGCCYGLGTYRVTAHAEEDQTLLREHTAALNAAAVVAMLDPNGRIRYVNEKFISASGFSQEELVGADHGKVFEHPDGTIRSGQIGRILGEGRIWKGEILGKRKDGTSYWAESTIIPMRNTNGKITQYAEIRFDISIRREYEIALEARQKELDQFFSLSEDILCVSNSDGDIKKISDSLERNFGISLDSLPEKRFFGLFHPDDARLVSDNLKKMAKSNSTARFSGRVVCQNGEYRQLSWQASASASGALYLIGRDISEIQAMTEKLEFSESTLSLAISGSSVGIWSWDVVSDNEVWSPRFYELLGYECNELQASLENFTAILHPEDREKTFALVEGHFKYGAPFEIEYRLKTKSGAYKWFYGTGKAQLDESGKPVRMVGSIQDIHARRLAEQALMEAKSQAESANRTKALFLANMSHEIRTPMNGIIGMANLLRASASDSTELERLSILQNCANALLEIVNDVLDFSKIEADKIELDLRPLCIERTIYEVIGLLASRASEKGLLLSYKQEENVPAWIEGDSVRLKQILTNVIANALKFTERGGVEVFSAAKWLGDAFEVQISVRDTGIGIPAEVQSKLFQSFSQVDASTTRRFGGTGLGLSICKGLCEKMGGRIWVESTPGGGSTFSFTFRANECPIDQRKDAESPLQQVNRTMGVDHPLSILIAEDNRINQMVALGFLEKLGYQADVVDSGAAALHMIKNKKYDLVLMDCHMPELDGFEATKKIVSLYGSERPQIVAFTASTMKADIEQCFESGMDGYLSKPLSFQRLIEVLSDCNPGAKQKTADITSALVSVTKQHVPPFDAERFLANFGGMEDIAMYSIQSFLTTLPNLMSQIDQAIHLKNTADLEISAHTLKGVVSNFFAEPTKLLAWKLEQLGHGKSLDGADKISSELRAELARLAEALSEFSKRRISA